ncbi:MAG TPA: NAD(+)/NADH kinase [Gemmatimonadaceae bacterium]|nr:NAD(+)/NADH kinase [Gemmatimonadaceae bacterium]
MRLGVIGHTGYDELPEILTALFKAAPALGLELLFEKELHEVARGGERLENPQGLDALVTLGGDGTLLRGARFLAGTPVPILGVNLGRLGFLTTCGSGDFDSALRLLAEKKFVAEARMTLGGSAVDGGGATRQQWLALNDFVLHKGGYARVVRLGISVDGDSIGTYAADGVIISTPTGSTAYSLSAGGPVVVPTVESIILTPISAHTLAVRPLVIAPSAEVVIEARHSSEELLVTVDGQVGTKLVAGEKLVVRRAPHPVLIVRLHGASFFERMRVKLGWGGLPERDEPT